MSPQVPPNFTETVFDVIVIGAGINGAGIARDAAMRGLRVLLLDKGDIGGGTTSWSTRLIHGGLRYLEHGEISLVRESLRERETLLRVAPHLVKPLPLLIPIYEDARRGGWTVRAGMIAYDLLSLDKSLSAHRMLSRDEALRLVPGLNQEGLRAAAIYYDAQVEFAERLALENVLSAKEHGATVATYARVDKLIIESGSVCGVECTGLLDGASDAVRGQIVVNAAGPWADQVLAGLELKPMIGGTKGSHLIVGPFPGAPSSALYVEAQTDHRPFFVIPWNGNYLIGTTDIRYDGDLDRVEIDESEVEYLLRETNRVVPTANLTQRSILFTYSGVRPLPFVGDRDEQSITRRHFVHDHTPDLNGFLSIVGGKLTTYRNLSEQAVDLVCKKLNRAAPICTTGRVPLPGATPDFASFSEKFRLESRLPTITNERLLKIYGTRAGEMLELASEDPSLAEVFSPETGAIAAEVIFSFQQELAQTLSDCLLRRTMVGLSSAVGFGEDKTVAGIGRRYLGWSESRAEREVAEYRLHVERFHPRSAETDL